MGGGDGEAGAERGNDGEFGLVGGVDDDGADAGTEQVGDDGGVMRNERVELKVEVGVEEGRHRRRAWLTEHAGGTEAKRWSEDRAVTGAATRMTRLRGEVFFGEGANGRAGAGETVAAGGAQVFCEVESSEGIEVEGGDISGRGAAVEIAQQGDQTANERAVGFAAEEAATVADFAEEMEEQR